ncbi:dephospho-CoA kinase [Taibaiella chishuiensis]|uniref:Dephospho-CoA kinase n=1 Tax=Taibaiella chishuiensis TaxID=1434707 RepID=A0A2P8D413_9BACT|nr:dephospho-CoA kinase [Taibaiella chishuiensis]PSK91946.1 dephospho-CoA kinase [Taibaiella chishuiensis]
MLKVGITGGIGSGKSLVARMFEVLGIPVLHADDTAKYLMQHDTDLMASISRMFGNEVYQNGRLNRPFLASVVFSDKEKLAGLNSLVHPAVLRYGKEWAARQSSPYTLKEAAIFFESGSYKEMDKMIGVYAPYELRLQRAMQRDQASGDTIKQRMAQQMDEEEKMKRCDYIIRNDGSMSVINQVLDLHRQFCAMASGRL